jgi:hypothetical protein
MANDQQPNQRRNDNQEREKRPDWRKPIGEPREDAQRAKEQNDRGDPRAARESDGSANRQSGARPNNANRRNNNDNRLTPEERQEKKFDLIRKNPYNSVVIIQNSGETRALANKAIDLDRSFSLIRENMFSRLPGEYGALALRDAQEALETLNELERGLNALRIDGRVIRKPVSLNPDHIKRFHTLKLQFFAKQAERLNVSLTSLGIEGEAISESLKQALASIEAKEREERDRIAKEQEEARVAKAEEKARRKAEYEARQAEIAEQKRLKAEEANRAKQADKSDTKGANDRSSLDRIDDRSVDRLAEIPSLTANQESEAEKEAKPSKAKKDKEKAV